MNNSRGVVSGGSSIVIRARKGLCVCGHLKWKEHKWYRIGENASLECVGCVVQDCRCEKYQPQQDYRVRI